MEDYYHQAMVYLQQIGLSTEKEKVLVGIANTLMKRNN